VETAKKNLFSIAWGRLKPEDRLTEMLAYLWQERPLLVDAWLATVLPAASDLSGWQVDTQKADPDSGRFDVYLRVPGQACAIVESKLGSDLSDQQVAAYLAHLATRNERLRGLITLTRDPVTWDPGLDTSASERGVVLVKARWRDVTAVIEDQGEDTGIAVDFATMLIEEGLVRPDPIVISEWATWNAGPTVLERLSIILKEAKPGLERLVDGLKATPANAINERWVYRMFNGERVSLFVGFAANESASRPKSSPIIWAGAKNPDLVGSEGKQRAEIARDRSGGSSIWDHQHIMLHAPAAEVVTASEFDRQIAQTVGFAYKTAKLLQDVGFIPEGVALRRPTLAV
jgi:hypothetical protein